MRSPSSLGAQPVVAPVAPTVRQGLAGDFRVFHRTYHPGRPLLRALAAFVAQPATGALLWFRLGASQRHAVSFFARRRLVRGYGCDVERGATIAPGLLIAHALGIVIGGGAVIGEGVKLHHHVSIGLHHGGEPTIESGVWIFAGAVVVGPITVGSAAMIGANAFVAADVAPGATVRGGTRWV